MSPSKIHPETLRPALQPATGSQAAGYRAAVLAIVLLSSAAAQAAGFGVIARDSRLVAQSFALNPPAVPCTDGFGGVLASAASAVVDSSADLAVQGAGCYADGFGRAYAGSYQGVQNVGFAPNLLSLDMAQLATATIHSEGFPGARSLSMTVNNSMDLELAIDGPTTFGLNLFYTGTADSLIARDFVRLEMYATSQSGLPAGGLFSLVGGDVVAGSAYSTQFTVNPNPDFRYFLRASTVAFADADVQTASALNFTLAAVPEPGTWAMLLGGMALLAGLRRRLR